MVKKRKSNFFIRLTVVLMIITSIVTGAYFLLDKLIVPKYFGTYNINNLGDLVSMISTLYNTPKEKDFSEIFSKRFAILSLLKNILAKNVKCCKCNINL